MPAPEELLVRIGADTAALKKGMKDAGREVQGLQKTTAEAGKGMDTAVAQAARNMQASIQGSVTNSARNLATLAAGFVSVGVAVTAFQGVVDEAAALGRLAQQTGITVEALSNLRFAVGSVGVDFQTFTQLVSGFAQRTAEGLANPTSAVSLALRDMGVSMRDAQGRTREFTDVLPELADWFAQTRDGIAKTQRAVALFGEEAGPQLIPLLNEGSAGIQRLIERAQQLGVTITSETARRAQEFQRTMFELGETLKPLIRQLVIQLAPVIEQLAGWFTEVARRWGAKARETVATYRELIDAERAQLARLREMEAAAQATITQLEGQSSRQGDLERWRQHLAMIQGQIEATLRNIQDLNRDIGGLPPPPLGAPPGQAAPTMGELSSGAQQAQLEAQANLALYQDLVFGIRTAFLTMGEAWSTTAQGIASWTGQLNTSFMSHAEILAQAKARIVAAYATQAERQRALVTFELALNKVQQQGALDTATAAASLVTQLWPQQKNAAIASAIIQTAVGVTRALTSGVPPWNLAQAALTAAAGAAQIANIKSIATSVAATTSSATTGTPSAPSVAAAPAAAATAPAGRVLRLEYARDHIYTGAQVAEVIGLINGELQRGPLTVLTGRPGLH